MGSSAPWSTLFSVPEYESPDFEIVSRMRSLFVPPPSVPDQVPSSDGLSAPACAGFRHPSFMPSTPRREAARRRIAAGRCIENLSPSNAAILNLAADCVERKMGWARIATTSWRLPLKRTRQFFADGPEHAAERQVKHGPHSSKRPHDARPALAGIARARRVPLPEIIQRVKILFQRVALTYFEVRPLERRAQFPAREFVMMARIDALRRGRVEIMVEVAVDAPPPKQEHAVVNRSLIGSQNDDASSRCKHAVNLLQHAPRRKSVMLDHVRIAHEIERRIGKRQPPHRQIALTIVHTVVRGDRPVSLLERTIVQRRHATAELRGVKRECANLRADIEHAWRVPIRRKRRQNVAQYADFLSARQHAIANPIRRMRSDARVAREKF